MEFINITIAQLNFRVGDLEGNLKKIADAWASQDHLTHIVVFPELALTGYPPQDLLHSIGFLKECKKKVGGINRVFKKAELPRSGGHALLRWRPL
jgi:NAD+ synthase (glutamine-hydrolysing)